MTIKIVNKTMYASDGEKLKEISCPKDVSSSKLTKKSDEHFSCNQCQRAVVNTDFLSEDELITLLRGNPETCLYINLMNPLFQRSNDV